MVGGGIEYVQFDKMWTLRTMGQASEATKRWIIELGGMPMIPAAIAAHPEHEEITINTWGKMDQLYSQ